MLTHRNAKDVPSAPHKLPKVAAKEARKVKTVEKDPKEEKPAKVAKTHLAKVVAKKIVTYADTNTATEETAY